MSQARSRSWLALAGGAALVAVLLLLSARPGTGQEQAAATAKPSGAYQNWTAESHDRTNFPLVGKVEVANKTRKVGRAALSLQQRQLE